MAGASVKLGHGALFASKESGCHHLFHRDNILERGCKVAEMPAFSNRKDPWGGGGCRETWKRNKWTSYSLIISFRI